jgi:hypothetical protein
MASFDPLPSWPSPPPSRRKKIGTVAVYAVAIAFGVALFSGNFPGLGGHISTNVNLDGREYYSDVSFLPFPSLGNNTTSPTTVVFHSVTFVFWMTGWGSLVGSFVHGTGTEANGTSYAFLLGGMAGSANRTAIYVSPDDEFAAAWSGEFTLQLMVAV